MSRNGSDRVSSDSHGIALTRKRRSSRSPRREIHVGESTGRRHCSGRRPRGTHEMHEQQPRESPPFLHQSTRDRQTPPSQTPGVTVCTYNHMPSAPLTAAHPIGTRTRMHARGRNVTRRRPMLHLQGWPNSTTPPPPRSPPSGHFLSPAPPWAPVVIHAPCADSVGLLQSLVPDRCARRRMQQPSQSFQLWVEWCGRGGFGLLLLASVALSSLHLVPGS